MTANFLHKDLAAGHWFDFSLSEQLGNIGSEVSRASRYKGKDRDKFEKAVERALELFFLTLSDPRWIGRLKEIGRAREVFCDALFDGEEYKSNLSDLVKYFNHFALAARR